MSDGTDPNEPDPAPDYPAGVLGQLMQQRDTARSEANRCAGLAEIYQQQAATFTANADQLQAAIDVMPPDAA